jgi:hypothetical protein
MFRVIASFRDELYNISCNVTPCIDILEGQKLYIYDHDNLKAQTRYTT